MLKFVPEPDEAKTLRAYKGDLQVLGRAERFMLTVLTCPRHAPAVHRLSAARGETRPGALRVLPL